MTKDKVQEMMMLQRKRGQLANALKLSLAELTKMGIRADVDISNMREDTAYLLINEDDVANFFGRKVKSHLRKLDKDIEVKSYYENEILVIFVKCNPEVNQNTVKEEIDKTKKSLESTGIKCEIMISGEYFSKVYLMISVDSIIDYLTKVVKNKLKSANLKVEVAIYRENKVLVVRFRK